MSPSSERTVRLPADLHARPAGQLARAAAGFTSTVTLAAGGREVKATSISWLMMLGATKGTDVTVRAEGPDADEAVEKLSEMLAAVTPIDAPASGKASG